MSWRLASITLAGALALGGAAGALVAVERAVVRISVQPTAVQMAGVELTGGAAGHNLTTTQLNASAAESLTVPAATRQLPATVAAGFVYFWCSPMTSCPNGYTVPAGTLLSSLGGARYVTDASAGFPSCQPSPMVAIHSLASGAAGNAGAGTVVQGHLPGYIHVTNSRPIWGGADARAVPIVTQSNIDTARATLTAKVEADLHAALRVEAGPLAYVAVGAPGFKIASDVESGDAVPTVRVTVSGTQRAVAFSSTGALTLLRSLLAGGAPRGYQLTPAPITATYSWDLASGGLTASAAAYAVPEIDAATLSAGMRGEDVSQATDKLQRTVPGSKVTILTSPFALPWLPVLADHIAVTVATSPI